MSPQAPVISVANVRKEFPGPSQQPIQVVDGITLSIQRGEIIGLLGTNGAGKSTLIDMILGLITPTSGRVHTAGTIGAMLQTGGLLPDLTVEATIRMIASTYDSPIRISTVLKDADLLTIRRRKVGKCSGGEQQRLRFALATLGDPDVLILDEPTAGMDAGARRAFWRRLRELAANGRTVIFSTHYLEEAQDFAERIVVLDSGRVLADGTVEEIRNLTSTQVVTAEFPTGVPANIPGVSASSTTGQQARFVSHDSDAVARHLLLHTDAHSLRISGTSLEDSFLALLHNNS